VRYQAALRPDRMKQGDFHSNRFSQNRDFARHVSVGSFQ